MIQSLEEYQRAHDYGETLQQMLLDLRRTHTESQFASMSKAFLKELARTQREITLFLATPEPISPQRDRA